MIEFLGLVHPHEGRVYPHGDAQAFLGSMHSQSHTRQLGGSGGMDTASDDRTGVGTHNLRTHKQGLMRLLSLSGRPIATIAHSLDHSHE